MKITSSISDVDMKTAVSYRITPTSDYIVTAAWVNVTNWTFTIPNSGRFTISASSSVQVTDTDANGDAQLYVRLAIGGRAIEGTMRRLSHNTVSGSFVFPFEISYTNNFTKNATITLQAYKPFAGDTCVVGGNTGTLGAIPNFEYNCISSYTASSQIPITPWKLGTLSIVGAITTPTKGTTAVDRLYWRRVGANMEILATLSQSGGGAVGSGEYYFLIPENQRVDSSILSIGAITGYVGVCGTCVAVNATLGIGRGETFAFTYSGTDCLILSVRYPGSGGGSCIVNSGGFGLSGVVSYTFTASVPIVGWQ